MQLGLLSKNTVIYSVGNVALRGAAFLLVPIFTYNLSVAEFGLLASFFVTIEFFLILMGLGMRTTLERFYNEFEIKNKTGQLLGTTIFINFLGCFLISFISIYFLQDFFNEVLHIHNISDYLYFVCGASISQSLFLQVASFFRAKNEGLKFTIATVFSALLLILLNFLFLIVFKMGIRGALIAQICSYGLTLHIMLIYLISKNGFSISFRLAKKLLKFGVPLIFSMSGQNIIGTAGMYILSYFAGLEIVAIYAIGNRLARIIVMVLILPFQMAFQPFVFSNLNNQDIKRTISRIFSYLLFSIAFISLILLMSIKLLIPIIAPPEYNAAYLVVLFLLPAFALQGLSVFGETLLNVCHKTHIHGLIYGVIGISSVLLNFVLIKILGWIGIVITFNFSSFLIAALVLAYGLKNYPIKIELRRTYVAATLYLLYLLVLYVFNSVSFIFSLVIGVVLILISVGIIYFGDVLNEREKLFFNKLFLNVQPYAGRN